MNAKDAPCQSAGSGRVTSVCFDLAAKKADHELNAYYQRVQSVLEGSDKTRLKAAQRIWLQYRDASCDAEHALYEGGSAAPMVMSACMEALTRHRTEELSVTYGWILEK